MEEGTHCGRVHLHDGREVVEVVEAAAADDTDVNYTRQVERRGRAQHRDWDKPLPSPNPDDMCRRIVG
jgi:hypothetical protein